MFSTGLAKLTRRKSGVNKKKEEVKYDRASSSPSPKEMVGGEELSGDMYAMQLSRTGPGRLQRFLDQLSAFGSGNVEEGLRLLVGGSVTTSQSYVEVFIPDDGGRAIRLTSTSEAEGVILNGKPVSPSSVEELVNTIADVYAKRCVLDTNRSFTGAFMVACDANFVVQANGMVIVPVTTSTDQAGIVLPLHPTIMVTVCDETLDGGIDEPVAIPLWKVVYADIISWVDSIPLETTKQLKDALSDWQTDCATAFTTCEANYARRGLECQLLSVSVDGIGVSGFIFDKQPAQVLQAYTLRAMPGFAESSFRNKLIWPIAGEGDSLGKALLLGTDNNSMGPAVNLYKERMVEAERNFCRKLVDLYVHEKLAVISPDHEGWRNYSMQVWADYCPGWLVHRDSTIAKSAESKDTMFMWSTFTIGGPALVGALKETKAAPSKVVIVKLFPPFQQYHKNYMPSVHTQGVEYSVLACPNTAILARKHGQNLMISVPTLSGKSQVTMVIGPYGINQGFGQIMIDWKAKCMDATRYFGPLINYVLFSKFSGDFVRALGSGPQHIFVGMRKAIKLNFNASAADPTSLATLKWDEKDADSVGRPDKVSHHPKNRASRPEHQPVKVERHHAAPQAPRVEVVEMLAEEDIARIVVNKKGPRKQQTQPEAKAAVESLRM